MVFKRYPPRRGYKKNYKKGGWRNMKLGTLARKAYAGVKMLKGIVNAEKKTYDKSFNTTSSSTGVISRLSDVPQGDDYNGREGRSILAKSHQMYGSINVNTSSTTPTVFRVIVFRDTVQDGSNAPVVSDILASGSVYDIRNPDPVMMKRFIILVDKVFNLSPDTRESAVIARYTKLSHHIKYAGTGQTDADQGEGSIWCITISNQATNTPTMIWTSRLRYYDN